MEPRGTRRLHRRRAGRRRRVSLPLGIGLALVASLAVLFAETRPAQSPRAAVAPTKPRMHPVHRPVPPRRPPQFVVVSFDGAGGSALWEYWRSVARRANAHFTFFV